MAHYCVIQKGYMIFGTGTSKEDAVSDCKDSIDKDDIKQEWDVDDFASVYESAWDGQFVLLECEEEIHTKAQQGIGIVYDVEDNIASLSFWQLGVTNGE